MKVWACPVVEGGHCNSSVSRGLNSPESALTPTPFMEVPLSNHSSLPFIHPFIRSWALWNNGRPRKDVQCSCLSESRVQRGEVHENKAGQPVGPGWQRHSHGWRRSLDYFIDNETLWKTWEQGMAQSMLPNRRSLWAHHGRWPGRGGQMGGGKTT